MSHDPSNKSCPLVTHSDYFDKCSCPEDPPPDRTHVLKCHPEPFRALWDGLKVHEARHNDCDFQVGDTLILCEWVPRVGVYTSRPELNTEADAGYFSGRKVTARVTYLTKGGEWGLPPSVCVMSVRVTARGSAD